MARFGSVGGAFQRAARAVAAWWPLTSTGAAFAALAAAAAAWGVARRDHVALAAGVTAGVTLLAAGALVGLTAWRLRRIGAPQVRALLEGRPTQTGRMDTVPAWIPLVEVAWRWASPAAAVTRGPGGEEVVTAARRGEAAGVRRIFRVRDALGLLDVEVDRTSPGPVRVSPDLGALAAVPHWVGWARGDALAHPEGPPDGDPYDMRPYVPGDPIRMVLWKVYARQRTLVVRTPERAVSPADDVALWLVAGPTDDAAAAASLLMAQQQGRRTWKLGADGVPVRATDRGAAEALILASADATAEEQGAGLAGFLAELPAGRQLVVFAPAAPGPWVERVVEALRGARARATVVLCADRLAPARQPAWWAEGASSSDGAAEARALLARFAGLGVGAHLVDRADGRSASSDALLSRRSA